MSKGLIVSTMFFATHLMANSQIFQAMNSKATDLQGGLTTLGVSVLTIAIMVGSMGAWMGWFSKKWAVTIIVAGVIFGSSATLAGWMIK